jgi:hypothetical protein
LIPSPTRKPKAGAPIRSITASPLLLDSALLELLPTTPPSSTSSTTPPQAPPQQRLRRAPPRRHHRRSASDRWLPHPPPRKSSCSHGDADSAWWRRTSLLMTLTAMPGTSSCPLHLRALSPPSPSLHIVNLDPMHSVQWPAASASHRHAHGFTTLEHLSVAQKGLSYRLETYFGWRLM